MKYSAKRFYKEVGDILKVGSVQEDKLKAKKLFKHYYDNAKGDMKKVGQEIEDVVNSRYVKLSNQITELLWDEFKKAFPS
jgi:hypothetical protein